MHSHANMPYFYKLRNVNVIRVYDDLKKELSFKNNSEDVKIKVKCKQDK